MAEDAAAENSPKHSENTGQPSNENGPVISWKRWLMLLIFSLITMTNSILFLSLAPIKQTISRYYAVQPEVLDWFPNMYFILYTLLSIPSAFFMECFGLRSIVLVVSGTQFVTPIMRIVGIDQNGFIFVFAGHIFSAFAYCCVLAVPARLSTNWFPPNERALSITIGASMNIFGEAFAFVISTQCVCETNNTILIRSSLLKIYVAEMVLCSVSLLAALILFEEKATDFGMKAKSERTTSENFVNSLKSLGLDLNFHLLCQSYAIYFALFNFFAISLDDLINIHFKHVSKEMGWMGFSYIVVSIPSSAIYGYILDKNQQFRLASILFNSSSCLLMLIFMLILVYTDSIPFVFAVCTMYGLVSISFYATGLAQATLMTYPVPEGVSSAVMLALGNLYSFAMVAILGKGISHGHSVAVGYIMIGLYGVSTFFVSFAKTRKMNKENS